MERLTLSEQEVVRMASVAHINLVTCFIVLSGTQGIPISIKLDITLEVTKGVSKLKKKNMSAS